ncbi:MAG: hypothetical protein WAO95_06630 [Burkholderiales bacterium]
MSAGSAPPGRDAAWVTLETPLDPARLAAFCRDLEALYRINPFLEFASWEQRAPECFRAEILNHSNGQRSVMAGSVVRPSSQTLRVDYAAGLKKCTRFEIQPTPAGSRLTITDEYEPAGADAPGAEVDRSLHAWGMALKAYLERDRRWRWIPLYRWSMRRVWLPMKPAARRITFLILVIGLADIGLIALGLAIYWIESGR